MGIRYLSCFGQTGVSLPREPDYAAATLCESQLIYYCEEETDTSILSMGAGLCKGINRLRLLGLTYLAGGKLEYLCYMGQITPLLIAQVLILPLLEHVKPGTNSAYNIYIFVVQLLCASRVRAYFL